MDTGLNKYYKLFGLPETATQAEIKQRYRRLVMRYHPDKNGGDQRKFIEIKEAYEYLSGRKTIAATPRTHTYSATRSTSQSRQQAQEERIKQARQRKRDTAYKEHIENENYYRKLISGKRWRFLRFSAYIAAFISLILIIELFLPYRYEQDRIIAYDRNTIGSFDSDAFAVGRLYTESGRKQYAESIPNVYYVDPDIFVVKSAILHNEIGYTPFYHRDGTPLNHTEKGNLFRIQFTLGAHSLLLVPILLIPVLVVLFRRKTFSFTVFYFVSLYFSIPLTYIYLFSDNRWLHLLSLGFA